LVVPPVVTKEEGEISLDRVLTLELSREVQVLVAASRERSKY
jgi:hypothetical protein